MRTKLDGRAQGGVKEKIGVVGRILRLNETIELSVLWGRLTEDRVPVGGRVSCEVLCISLVSNM